MLIQKTCCEIMLGQLNQTHPDRLIIEETNGILYLQSRKADYFLYFCPWCGTKLQEKDEV